MINKNFHNISTCPIIVIISSCHLPTVVFFLKTLVERDLDEDNGSSIFDVRHLSLTYKFDNENSHNISTTNMYSSKVLLQELIPLRFVSFHLKHTLTISLQLSHCVTSKQLCNSFGKKFLINRIQMKTIRAVLACCIFLCCICPSQEMSSEDIDVRFYLQP